jgi:tetratricopeptide (TPR) repeat protein
LRPEVPALEPGKTYLLETVIRTLKMGHPFTQGTADSNEVWLDVAVTSGGHVIGRSGAIDDDTQVDPWSHFVNVFMLDRRGNRIDRRNPQDIFVPLYNNQIPPGAAQTVHYELFVPDDVSEPIAVDVKLRYRKFDKIYADFFTSKAKPGDLPIRGHEPGKPYRNELPVVTLASDRVVFPVKGKSPQVNNPLVDIPEWQRWNDYGIGLFLKGQGKAEPRQAEEAFRRVEELHRCDGPLNLARVYYAEGRIDDAVDALARAGRFTDPPAPPWTLAWLSGLVNREQGRLAEAERNFRSVLYDRTPERLARGFDFSLDLEVINLLGLTLFDRARQIRDPERQSERQALLQEAVAKFHDTLKIDPEDVTAHYELSLLYQELGDAAKADEHRTLHARYKLDDNARDLAVGLARKKYPAANHAAEPVVIYPLARPGAPGLGRHPQTASTSRTSREKSAARDD